MTLWEKIWVKTETPVMMKHMDDIELGMDEADYTSGTYTRDYTIPEYKFKAIHLQGIYIYTEGGDAVVRLKDGGGDTIGIGRVAVDSGFSPAYLRPQEYIPIDKYLDGDGGSLRLEMEVNSDDRYFVRVIMGAIY